MAVMDLPHPSSADRIPLLGIDLIRNRALARLYERRIAVDDLIRSLEDYRKSQEGPKG